MVVHLQSAGLADGTVVRPIGLDDVALDTSTELAILSFDAKQSALA